MRTKPNKCCCFASASLTLILSTQNMAKQLKIGAAVTVRVYGSHSAAAARYGMNSIRPSVSLELSQLPTIEVDRGNDGLFFFPTLNKRIDRVFISFTTNG